jgi:alpha-tubulin suppressor-like RCC1 family protein
VKQVALGSAHTCVVDVGGVVSCWGNGRQGELGNGGEFGNGPNPVHVTGLDGGFESVSAGEFSNCALKNDGTVWCWGYNTEGELGYATSPDAGDQCCGVEGCFENTCFTHFTPVQVPTIANATSVSVGCDHACALEKDGSVWCWGGNESGQLGRGNTSITPSPAQVPGITGAAGVAVGCGHTCAWTTDGKASCWGKNDHGQIGNGAVNSPSPLPVQGLP